MPLLRAALSWNFVLATAICASLLAQLIKVLLNLFIFHRFIAERMWELGMPPAPHIRSGIKRWKMKRFRITLMNCARKEPHSAVTST